ncbi:MAG: copper resistance protein NlpE [Prevotellaceae bacterium]|jgi:uncharacterized lipoprotein NlpE involved in copper resistance|nr:copper resistance protein NlpE [Prevotellaceae bacterium]
MRKIIYAMSTLVAMSVGFASCTQCCKQKEVPESETIVLVTEVQQPEAVAEDTVKTVEKSAAEVHRAHRVVHEETSPETVTATATTTATATARPIQRADFKAVPNARANVKWAGTYTGVLPCADCDGIAVQFILREDGTYDLVYSYLGLEAIPYELMGQFTWDKTGSEIILDATEDKHTPTHYKVGDKKLLELNFSGKEITGSLANRYILTKQ